MRDTPRISPRTFPLPYRLAKRGLDLGVALTALLVGGPALTVVALALKRSMGGPVLFRDERAGLGGRPFHLVKFRTMHPARPGEEGPDSDATRLTPLGRRLRETSIDELPSLWNVVTGDMSLVGPRPLPVRYISRYDAEQARRLEVKPGLTGWAQVHGRNRPSWEEKHRLDVWYVDHASMLLDLRILLMTASRVWRGEGVSHEHHATMPEFTGSERGAKGP